MNRTFIHCSRLHRSLCAALLTLLLVAAAVPAAARAPQALPADVNLSTLTLSAVADTFVDQLRPTANYGAQPILSVRAQNAPAGRDLALIRFDLSDIPDTATVTRAELVLHQETATFTNWAMAVAAANAAWDENAVTWNTAPAEFTQLPPVPFTSPLQDDVTLRVNVTNIVNGWVNNADTPNFGFIVRGPLITAPIERTFTSREQAEGPRLEIDVDMPPIRVCIETVAPDCAPAAGAVVARVSGRGTVTADAEGLLPDTLTPGELLWPRHLVSQANGGALYSTAPAPVEVTGANYAAYGRAIELRIAVTAAAPLWLQDVTASAQWYVEGDAAAAARMRARIIEASNALYSFTDGQFALGTVTIHQRFEQWAAADMHLHASNTLQPKAAVGGVVAADTPDINAALPLSYTPGALTMGSEWNRFGTPPGSVNVFNGVPFTDAQMANDWSLALAHELGHWLLYLFDTYTGVDGKSDHALTLLCTGTAMGDVYLPANQNFIANPATWAGNCGGTEAFALLGGRTEWATIDGWYPWVNVPALPVAGPAAPPAPVTTVAYMPSTPGQPAATTFDLVYQENELSSGEARAFLLRGNFVIEQGKPAKGTTQVQLTGPEVGDRLCVYDINDHAEPDEQPRHQFGCETIAANDSTLVMTRNPAWRPVVTLQQTGPASLAISVQQGDLGPNVPLRGRIFPENGQGFAEFELARVGALYTANVTLPAPNTMMPLYLQLYAGEAPGAPTTRREVIADRGTGGGGAHGPAKFYSGVLVVSSDGNASWESDEPTELGPGESIGWQSMPGTPPLPFHKWIYGQSYRLDAFPDALVQGGQVNITFDTGDFGVAAAGSAPDAARATTPKLFFWNGSVWRELPTTITASPAGANDGEQVASAPGQGEGVYAVLADAPPGANQFLPLVRN